MFKSVYYFTGLTRSMTNRLDFKSTNARFWVRHWFKTVFGRVRSEWSTLAAAMAVGSTRQHWSIGRRADLANCCRQSRKFRGLMFLIHDPPPHAAGGRYLYTNCAIKHSLGKLVENGGKPLRSPRIWMKYVEFATWTNWLHFDEDPISGKCISRTMSNVNVIADQWVNKNRGRTNGLITCNLCHSGSFLRRRVAMDRASKTYKHSLEPRLACHQHYTALSANLYAGASYKGTPTNLHTHPACATFLIIYISDHTYP